MRYFETSLKIIIKPCCLYIPLGREPSRLPSSKCQNGIAYKDSFVFWEDLFDQNSATLTHQD
jgi:hypothetical protein